MAIPKKIVMRKHEITNAFFNLLDQHIEDILAGKINYLLNSKDFAEQLSIDATHFSSTIKLVTKRRPMDFVEERLVAEAQKMLSETTQSVSEICSKLTFQDPASFTKIFKRHAGKTPHAYKDQFAESQILT
jgi:AraC family transcriptional regulator, regulatory protein of adaptative response / methylphosphotriester-DNA alkyltransferase methyltransferase